ncbi:MAG TPA: efflux RND transporter permease subunit [Chloroflexota bacterium]|nr:efflux RND transporter permease subunit [Chloroflexota bacterium]
MGLTRVALLRPVAITMLFLALAAMGIVAYTRLPVERFPTISFPVVTVSIGYPGAPPEDVEALVTKPVENAVVGVNGIDTISSNSNQGQSRVTIRFVEGYDVNLASIDIERKINTVRRRLPTTVTDPSINKADITAFPVMNIGITSSKLSPQDLAQIVNDQIQPLIQSINGVADATALGEVTRQINVRVDTDKLRAYGISLTQVQNALVNQNLALPAGPIRTNLQVFNTRTSALAQQPSDLNNIPVNTPAGNGATGAVLGITGSTTNPTSSASSLAVSGAGNIVNGSTNNQVVYIKDVADVLDTTAFRTSYLRLNTRGPDGKMAPEGTAAVGMSITAQAGVNGIQMADDIRKTLNEIQSSALGQSNGIVFAINSDQAIFTRAAVDDVQRNLYLAILLTAMVLMLFLHTFRNTLMVLVAIPTSLVSTFFIMFLLGFSLDTMSLMALALLIGILVDDSIVVLENINRHLALGEKPWDAALNGRSEIGLAAIAITMTDVVVYTPVAFMAGNIGQLFREFGLTIVAATLFSLLVSFTLTPMLASRLLKGESLEHISGNGLWARFTRAWEGGFHKMSEKYRGLLGHALNLRWLPVLVGFAMLGLVISFVPLHVVGTEFVPQEDDGLFSVGIQMPVGYPIEATDAATKQVEAALAKMPEVNSIYAQVGGGNGEQSSNIAVGLVDKSQRKRSVFDLVAEMRRIGATIPGMQLRTQVPSPLIGGGGAPVDLFIGGNDFGQLQAITNQVLQIVNSTPGTTEVRTSKIAPAPEFRAVVDRKKAADQGVTASTIANTVATAVQGLIVSEFQPEGQDQVDINLQLKGAETMTPDQLSAIPILTTKGTVVRLDQVANIVRTTSPSQIQRFNRQRDVEVQANVNGRAVGDVLREILQKTDQLQLPVGYTITVQGQGSQLDKAFAALTQALALSIVLMYMLMAALYESFIYPLAVIFCLPVALVGAFLGLIAVGDTINIFSMIGMIMLMGLVAKNAILLVDYTNTLRRRGMSRRDALIEAGPTRLRPILMTTMVLVFAMIPLALKLGDGAESRSPMAIVVLGGMITSTLLTLVMVPCVYTYLDDFQNFLMRRGRRVRAVAPQKTPPPVMAGASEDGIQAAE